MSRKDPWSSSARSAPSSTRHQDRRADERHGQQHLKRRGGDELNRDDGPVCRGEERAALEEMFERHVCHVNREHTEPQTVFTAGFAASAVSVSPLYAVFIVLNSPTLGGIVRAGLIAALAVAAGGWTLERVRFGASDAEAIARVEAETQQRFDASADNLGTLDGPRRQPARADSRGPARCRRRRAALRRARRRAGRRPGTHGHYRLRRGRDAGGVGRPRRRSAEAARRPRRRSWSPPARLVPASHVSSRLSTPIAGPPPVSPPSSPSRFSNRSIARRP